MSWPPRIADRQTARFAWLAWIIGALIGALVGAAIVGALLGTQVLTPPTAAAHERLAAHGRHATQDAQGGQGGQDGQDGRGEAPRRASGGVAPAATATPPARRWGAGYFPNVPLQTQDGQTLRFYDDLLKGKAVAINLFYSRCEDECPLETARLAQVRRLLGDRVDKEIHFYSISIDPERDTPAVLKAYAEKFQVGGGWLFLTGRAEDIRLIAGKLGLSSRTDTADRDRHLPGLMVGSEATGQWMRLSAVDDPRFLASKISSFLTGWKDRPAPAKSYALARPIEELDAGAYLFRTRCAACHTIGQGDALGPDLAGVGERRPDAWLKRFIGAPDAMLAEKDPIALELFAKYKNLQMPNLRLGDGDVENLIRYLKAQDAALRSADRVAGAGDGPSSR